MCMVNQSEIKEKVKERYGKIALVGNIDHCCLPSECCNPNETVDNKLRSAKAVGYEAKDLESIPQSAILGVGCGNPIKFAYIKEGNTVVDLGSGAGIDVFLAANLVKDGGKVIGIDMTDEMLEKARENAIKHGYTNVEFRKGDIESRIPIDNNSVDVVISNCVINLTTDKVRTFREIHRILKPNGIGKTIISDLVTDREVDINSADTESWCSCIDGALTKDNYLDSIRKAGFSDVEVLDEKAYIEYEQLDRRKITSIVVKAIKD